MGSVRLTWKGMAELRAALAALPEALRDEAAGVILDTANDAADEIRNAYPEGDTGNLRKGVKVDQKNTGRFGTSARVRSTAQHSHLYEYGTQTRQTALGYNRGVMPGIATMIPIMMRRRRTMVGALVDIVEGQGFTIRGRE